LILRESEISQVLTKNRPAGREQYADAERGEKEGIKTKLRRALVSDQSEFKEGGIKGEQDQETLGWSV